MVDSLLSVTTPGKVWAFKDPAKGLLTGQTKCGLKEWKYHVAATVPVVLADGKEHTLVLDPSQFGRPVAVDEWQKALGPNVKGDAVTSGFMEPLPGYTGTGFWPANGPTVFDLYTNGPKVLPDRNTLSEYSLAELGKLQALADAEGRQ